MDLLEQEELAAEKHKNDMKHERELWEQKVEFEKKRDKEKATQNKSMTTAAEIITPFNGRIEEWLPFWGKFSSEIDDTNLNSLTKFDYLKELLDKSVKTDIDGLPFTEDGYANAKAILEAEYGQPTKIVNAYMKTIMELPVITGTSPKKVKEFYKQLRFSVQSLETLGRLGDVKGNMRATLDKLKGTKADLVHGNDGWKDWNFKELLKELKRWTDINPVEETAAERGPSKGNQNWAHKQTSRTSFYNAQSRPPQEPQTGNQCVYCDRNHKAKDCTTVTDTKQRRGILSNKKLCFNCTGTKHRADDCKSKTSCQKCKRRHHTSLCDARVDAGGGPLLIATGAPVVIVIYPVVIVQVEGIKCRALLDTGAGSSYASAALLDQLSKHRVERETRKI